ncbi:VOC family protein [Nonomuraea sp. CA-141351]|uniref:VOC family protein n=1 Tax=Nonomuraea sp. CA-141351 TaxID=3239996 RepID=UPI003D913844
MTREHQEAITTTNTLISVASSRFPDILMAGGRRCDDQGSFQVMADPEGNEFCFVAGL